jgi:hypothetical protein
MVQDLPKPNALSRSLWLLMLILALPAIASAQASSVSVSVSQAKVDRGQTVEINVKSTGGGPVRAVLLRPGSGAEELALRENAGQKGVLTASVTVDEKSQNGLYAVHAWTGDKVNPNAVGKGAFRTGNIVADFFVANYVDQKGVSADIGNYLRDFRSLGGNFLIAHNLIVPAGAFYPSKISKTNVQPGAANDIVEQLLSQADQQGISVLLSANWDATRESPYNERMKEIRSIISELYALYRHHPSFVGFYSWQEGSGTYYAPYVREFSEHVKSLDKGLLTACAPHIDDPLLASYLSTIEQLDVLIYQGAVMGSYRTDNRKKYPLRRVRDFSALGAGAKRLQNKITLTQVELFGYLEKRRSADHAAASYNDIYGQILSAATVTDTDGISLFTYHAIVYEPLKKFADVRESREAVADGLKAYNLITAQVSDKPDPIALYVPYSDFVIERWSSYFLPALDAFRALGTAVDILPYAPRLDESVYPYYPIHHNPDVLERLLKDRTVLVLANVSGFQQTDSDLIKAFVERGGVVLAFGPQIPMGRSYERKEVFGIDEGGKVAAPTRLVVRDQIGPRAKVGRSFSIQNSELPVWVTTGARVLAAFEDGSPAAVVNQYGRGLAITVFLDATTAVKNAPEWVRDVLTYADARSDRHSPVDIVGSNENADVAVRVTNNGFRTAFVNHNSSELEIKLVPTPSAAGRGSHWKDLVSGGILTSDHDDRSLTLSVKGNGFRVVEYSSR